MRRTYLAFAGIFVLAVVSQIGQRSANHVDQPLTTSQNAAETRISSPQTKPQVVNPASKDEGANRTGTDRPRYISGSRVAFRSGPSTSESIIDRFDSGRQVLLIERSKDWSRVRDHLSQREGWIASRFLEDKYEAPRKKPREEISKPKELPKIEPKVPDSVIVQRIIAESLASYPSSCACPYNTDRGGRRCGKRSAYSKPGGYSPICFPQDVTSAMIDAFRKQ